tara:strand:+ start:2801 stop:2995 length:195 start_codon:yes stop_codon:yes gene_type:complete
MPHTSLGCEVIEGISTPNLTIKGSRYSGSRRSKLYANTLISGLDSAKLTNSGISFKQGGHQSAQ